MLPAHKAIKGCYLMVDFVKELAGNLNAQTVQGKFVVSAKVNDELIVDRDKIECIFTIQFDSVEISVYWEESGYKNYRRLGLYGLMSTKWQEVKRRKNKLYVMGSNYKIRIEF